jgi:rubrerythrin
MNNIHTLEDAIRFAISEEQKAVDFYQDLAKQVVKFESRILLEQLSRDEMRHKVILSSILENNDFRVEQKSLESLAKMLNENLKTITVPTEITEILSEAIKRELEAANIYKELATSGLSTEVSQLFIVMCEEELKHKRSLELELEFYTKGK